MDPLIIAALIAATASLISAVISARQGKRIKETHKQVTVNSHSSTKPTVLDLISDVKEEQIRVRKELSDHKVVVSQALEQHLAWHLDKE